MLCYMNLCPLSCQSCVCARVCVCVCVCVNVHFYVFVAESFSRLMNVSSGAMYLQVL